MEACTEIGLATAGYVFTSLLETFLVETVEEHLTVKCLYIHTGVLRRKTYLPAGCFQLMEQVLLFLLVQPLA